MVPMKIYGWAVSPWMARVLVCLEEAEAKYEIIPMSRSGSDHRRAEHLVRNPFGEIPVLEDGDLTLYQSCVIARHVLRKHKPELLHTGDLAGSAAVDVWAEVEAQKLEPARLPIVVNCLIAPHVGRDRDQGAVDASLAKLRDVLRVYEAQLAGGTRFLAGNGVTAADLFCFGFMRYFMATEYAGVLDAYPCARAWWEALLERPAVRKVMAGMPPDFGFGSGNIP